MPASRATYICVVGLNPYDDKLSKIDGNVPLDEALFVLGFIEGFRQSRKQKPR